MRNAILARVGLTPRSLSAPARRRGRRARGLRRTTLGALAALVLHPGSTHGQVSFLSPGAGIGVSAGQSSFGPGTVGVRLERRRESFFPSWFTWWETRRDGFLADAWPDGVPPEPDDAWRDQAAGAAEALALAYEALPSPRGPEDARREAALVLALGRVGGPRASAVLLATNGPMASPSAEVRGMARLALGLLATDPARERLLADLGGDDPSAAAGAAAGLSLLPELREADERALFDAVRRGPGDQTRRLALQALALQGSSINAQLMPAVLREVPRVFLAEQALLAAKDFPAGSERLLRNHLRLGGRFNGDSLRDELRLLSSGFGRPSVVTSPQVRLKDVPVVGPAPPRRSAPATTPTGPAGDGSGGSGGGSGGGSASGGGSSPGGGSGAGVGAGAGGEADDGGAEGGAGGAGGPGGAGGAGVVGPGGVSPPFLVGPRRFPSPLESRLETAAALGLAELEPSTRGFAEDVVEELSEILGQAEAAGSDPSRSAMLLALGYLAVDERDGVIDQVVRIADGDGPDGLLIGVSRIRLAGEPPIDVAALDRDTLRAFGSWSAALLVRRLWAGPDTVSIAPLRLSDRDARVLRRETRRALLGNVRNERQPRGVRLAAALALGFTADRGDPDGSDALARGGGLSFDPVTLAAGDPLVLAGLLCSLETLAGQRAPATAASRQAEERVRAATDDFLGRIAAGAKGRPLTGLGLAAARVAIQGLAHRPADAPLDGGLLDELAAAHPVLALDVAAASRWRNDSRLGPALARRLSLPGPDGVAAAWAMGVLFDAQSPSGLSRLARQTNPLVVYRDDAPRLLSVRRADLGGGVTVFRSDAWWQDPRDAMVIAGWPEREETGITNPYLAWQWDEQILEMGR